MWENVVVLAQSGGPLQLREISVTGVGSYGGKRKVPLRDR